MKPTDHFFFHCSTFKKYLKHLQSCINDVALTVTLSLLLQSFVSEYSQILNAKLTFASSSALIKGAVSTYRYLVVYFQIAVPYPTQLSTAW